MIDLNEKIVLITGSSIGIGRETAFKFSSEGCKVIITYYKDKNEAYKVADKCKELGASDVYVTDLNLMSNGDIQRVIGEIVDKFGAIDILVNNAGVIKWEPLNGQSFDDIENQVRTNLEGLIKITKEALPYLRYMIINISSGAGKTGFSDLTTYCATKFGVRGFTQALSQELSGVSVYSVNPGMTATRMTGYQGVEPVKVSQIILDTARNKFDLPSGSDVDVWQHL